MADLRDILDSVIGLPSLDSQLLARGESDGTTIAIELIK